MLSPTFADLPLPPDLAGIARTVEGDDVIVTVPGLGEPSTASGKRTASLHTGRRRICGRRMVALGQKPLLVGGPAEGIAFRDFASRQVKPPLCFLLADNSACLSP